MNNFYFKYIFQHPINKKKIVSDVYELIDIINGETTIEEIFVETTSAIYECDCKPVGETYVVECNCDSEFDDYVLVDIEQVYEKDIKEAEKAENGIEVE